MEFEQIQYLVIGAIFTIGGISTYLFTYGLRKNGVKTSATVISHKSTFDGEGSNLNEVFEFENENGEVQNAKSILGTSFGLYRIGQKIEIIYDKQNPNKAMPNKPYLLNIYILPIIIGIGLIIYHFMK